MSLLNKLGVVAGVVVFLLLVAILLGGLPFGTVSKGHVGVKTRFGKVVGNALDPGFNWKTPFIETITQINVQQDNAIEHSQAASKDLQKVDTDVKILYSLNPSLIPLAFDRVGSREDIVNKIISPAIKETFKAVNARYTAEELIAKRNEVSVAIHDDLDLFISKSCKDEGLDNLVRLDNVAIEDFKFSPDFDQAIEQKMVSEQEDKAVTQAEAKKEEVRLASEAEALRIQNQATADAFKIEAAAKANAFKIESESVARAEAIKREAEALKGNPDLIKLRQVEIWDGKLPTFTGNSAIPFMNIDMKD